MRTQTVGGVRPAGVEPGREQIKHRYLDYKYGEGMDEGSGVPLPDFSLDQQKTAG